MDSPSSASSLLSDQLSSGLSGSKRAVPASGPRGKYCLPSHSGISGTSGSQSAGSPGARLARVVADCVDTMRVDLPDVSPVSDAVPVSEDILMDPPTPPASAGVDASPPGPTMADILGNQEHLRRDHAAADAARRRVETPKPLASDIEWIEQQYAAGGDWSFIASRIDQARPYALPRARYDMVIATGRTLAKTPLQKIMVSLSSTHHGNDSLEDLYRRHEIGQISKLPGGDLRVKVKTKDACLLLERTKVNILGGVYTFKEFDVLGGKYFLDISNMDSETDTSLILQRLFLLGCKPVYDTFREVNVATGITSATWRVYFMTGSCPNALVVNGSVCDQVLFDNKLHPAHGKNAPFQSVRMPFGYRSHHGIDLGTTTGAFSPNMSTPASPTPLARPTSRSTYSHAVTAPSVPAPTRPATTSSLRKEVENATKREGQLRREAQHRSAPASDQLILTSSTSGALSVSTFKGSNGKLTPPGSPRACSSSPLLLTNGDADGFIAPPSRKKRGRNAIDFSNMLVKPSTLPLDGIATSNYFQALQTMEVRFESSDITSDPAFGVRHQVLPLAVKRPVALTTSTESAFFVEKHHTKIKKAAKASFIPEVAEAMLNDENTALLSLLPDLLTEADTKVAGICKIIKNAANPDHFTKKAIESPLAFNSALSLSMSAGGPAIEEIAQLHAINRVLCATDPTEDVTFNTKWKKLMGMAVPSKRSDLFPLCAQWWTSSPEIEELSRASKALGLFELMLMSIAPLIFANDHWIQYITGRPVEWIPAHHTRLLHPNTLLRLLRSELGAHCMQQWAEVQWQGHLLDTLDTLRALSGYYPMDSSVLKLRAVNGEVTILAGGLASRC